MTPLQKFKTKKAAFAVAIILITGSIFTFFAFSQISAASTYQINTNRQTLQFAFDRVGRAYYSSSFNITRVKEFTEFQQYARQAKGETDYYNLSLLCRRMNIELFKELDRNVMLSFYLVGTDRVVGVSSTQESGYYFHRLGTSTADIEKISGTEYFIDQNRLIQIKHDRFLGQDVFWITSFSTNELFRGILKDDLYWDFFDRNNKLVFSHVPESANFSLINRHTYIDYYSGNYFHYYTPKNLDYAPLVYAALYTFFISFFFIVVQSTVSKRRFTAITKELDIPNNNVLADDIVDKIRAIKDESTVLEESFHEVKKITAKDSLKDYLRGVKTYIELEPEITDSFGTAELLLLCVTITPANNAPKGYWKEIYNYIKDTLGILVLVMTPEKLLVLCSSDEEKLHLENLNDYAKKLSIHSNTVFSIRSYGKSSKLQDMEGASFEFDTDTSLPSDLDKNDDVKNKMVQYVHRNYERDISLNDLAEYMLQTEKYVSTLFKYETGTNFKEYLTRYRMTKAENLLLTEEDVKIKTIARKVGYNSSNSFIRVFRNYFGVSPLSYKKNSEDFDSFAPLE